MSSYASHAAEEIKSFANKFKTIISISDTLEKIGSLEQAASDALKRKDAAYADEAKAKSKLLIAESDLEKAKALVKDVEESRVKLEAFARQSASQIIEDAKAEAKKVLDSAEKMELAAKELTVGARLELNALQGEIVDKKSELRAIQKQIDELKSKIEAFVR